MANRYWVGGSGNWDASDTSHWAATSGGASGASVPTTSDSVLTDTNSGGGTITCTATVNMAGFNNPSGTVSFSGNGQTINSTGQFNWADRVGATLDLTNSTMNTNNWVANPAAARFVSTGSTINLNGTMFFASGQTFNIVNLTSSAPVISNAYTFATLNWTPSAPTPTSNLTLGANQTVTSSFTVAGGSTLNRLLIASATAGTQRTITAASVTASWSDWSDIIGAGAFGWDLSANTGGSGNAGNNTGITFTTPVTQHWGNVNGGNWGDAANWVSGIVPLPQDTAVMDCAYGTSKTVTSNTPRQCATDWTGATWTTDLTWATSSSTTLLGSLTGISGLTLTGTILMRPRSAASFTRAGVTISIPCTFGLLSSGATITLADAFTTSGTTTIAAGLTLSAAFSSTAAVTHTGGTITSTSYNLTCLTFNTNNGNTRGYNIGANRIICTGNAGTVWTSDNGQSNLTITGTCIVECNYSGSTGTRTLNFGGSVAGGNTFSLIVSAGSDTITINQAGTGLPNTALRSLNLTGFTGTWGGGTNPTLKLFGSLTIPANIGALPTSTGAITIANTSGTSTITTNGLTIDRPIIFDGAGGTFALGGALTLGSTRLMTLTNGTLNLAGYTLTTGTYATAAGTKNLTWNGGTLVISGSGTTAFNNAQPTNFTTTAGTGTGYISMSSATAKTFVGGGSTFNATLSQDGAGALTITGSNTLADIRNTTQPVTVSFTAATTTTFTSGFSLSGTAGNLVTIGSVTAASHTLSKASGTVDVSYCSISRSTATGGATWLAYV